MMTATLLSQSRREPPGKETLPGETDVSENHISAFPSALHPLLKQGVQPHGVRRHRQRFRGLDPFSNLYLPILENSNEGT